MSRVHIAVLRGGPSSEYEVSLASGATVLKHMPEHFAVRDIFISKDGVWHDRGVPREPHEILRHVDVVFNAMHGEYGEDGKVQSLLEAHRMPYTGSDAWSSAFAMNKRLSKDMFIKAGLKTPAHVMAHIHDDPKALSRKLWRSFIFPAVVKPVAMGSSVGVSIVKTEEELAAALEKVFALNNDAMVEEFIDGVEASCGVIDRFRGKHIYPLFPVEIRPNAKKLFDYEAKYTPNASTEFCPGRFSEDEKRLIQEAAIKAHEVLGLRHYSRSDFMVHPRRGVYILETNTLPGMTDTSLLPVALEAHGIPIKDFVHHIVMLALGRVAE